MKYKVKIDTPWLSKGEIINSVAGRPKLIQFGAETFDAFEYPDIFEPVEKSNQTHEFEIGELINVGDFLYDDGSIVEGHDFPYICFFDATQNYFCGWKFGEKITPKVDPKQEYIIDGHKYKLVEE